MNAPYCTVIYQFCAHCGAFKGTIDGKGESGNSHGICVPCSVEWFKEWNALKAQRKVTA